MFYLCCALDKDNKNLIQEGGTARLCMTKVMCVHAKFTMNIAMSHESLSRDGKLTFVGVLRKYFVEYNQAKVNIGLSARWNKDTQAAYISDYELRLIPTLDGLFGDRRPLEEFSGDDFDACLNELAEEFHYVDSTRAHYRYLLWIVYQAGFEHGHYQDQIFWADLTDPNDPDELVREAWRVNVMTRLRKSFGIAEELKILNWFLHLDPVQAAGEEIGILLMFFLGLRNNEACGADFGRVYPQTKHPEVKLFDMLQSTQLGSNEIKSGGKTSNAPRLLILPEQVYEFLEKRRSFLEEAVAQGKLVLPKGIHSVDELPIVCRGVEYGIRADSDDLSKKGRQYFEMLGISNSEIGALFQILSSSEAQENQIEEKEPTTYLFRRNCGTHLYQLGFSESDIQYWMGHEIEDKKVLRSFYTDPDKLLELKRKYDRHPVLQFLSSSASQESETIPRRANCVAKDAFTLTASEENSSFLVKISGCEPNQPIRVSVSSEKNFHAVAVSHGCPVEEYPSTVVVFEQQQKAYRRHSRKLGVSVK